MRVLNEQWEDSLRSKRYPFAGTGDMVANSGEVLPVDAFLDLNVMVGQETTRVLLSQVVVDADEAVFSFTLQDGTIVGTLTVDPTTPELTTIVLGTLTVGYARINVDAMALVRNWAFRTHAFTALAIIPHLLVVSPKEWRPGFELPDGQILTGDVYLVADKGVWLERTVDGFAFHVTGDPFFGRSVSSRGLLTLNGQNPDANGNVNLIGLSTSNFAGIVFTAAGNTFRINLQPGQNQLKIELVGV